MVYFVVVASVQCLSLLLRVLLLFVGSVCSPAGLGFSVVLG